MSASKLNLGCGNQPKKDAINHDLFAHSPFIDVVWNLNNLPWPWPDEAFEHVWALSVFEHLELRLLDAMNEAWRILVPNGIAEIKLPYWGSDSAYSDPTHRYVAGEGIMDAFDPYTERGKEYLFYTPFKWRILLRRKVNKPVTSLYWKMQKLTSWEA